MLNAHTLPDLRLLAHFLAVVEAGSVTRAAERLRLTQPALSRQMQQLERSLDTRLFDRTTTGVRLSSAGLTLLPLVQALIDRAEGVQRAVEQVATDAPLTFRVACPEATVRGVISPFVAETAGPISGTEIDLAVRVYDHVVSRSADLAVNTLPPPLGLESELIDSAPVQIHVTPGHPLAASDSVDASDLAGESIIVLASGSGLRQVVDRALWPVRDRITIVAEPSSSDLAMALAATGAGVCIDVVGAQFGLVGRPFTSEGNRVRMPIYAAWEADHFAAEQLRSLARALTAWSGARVRD
ncbi:hypothetical protein ASE14_15670 [Agromyces sp. Root81]|uniref:LysR family transcriptional regulator n=1 Tax=Agromyces sp. Root81 TaxID=1736601 RepID=UPI0006FD3A76|nr:LysR family transcriptional regulator [Agromyces sp. Root81]KRC59207.1 hypothetical protein ASE14_15670 [Agromyces sp. Root81]